MITEGITNVEDATVLPCKYPENPDPKYLRAWAVEGHGGYNGVKTIVKAYFATDITQELVKMFRVGMMQCPIEEGLFEVRKDTEDGEKLFTLRVMGEVSA